MPMNPFKSKRPPKRVQKKQAKKPADVIADLKTRDEEVLEYVRKRRRRK